MPLHKSAFTILCLLVLCSALFGCNSRQEPAWQAQQGVLDLRQWHPEASPEVPLSGEWALHWKQYVPPALPPTLPSAHPAPTAYVAVPSLWKHYADSIHALGHATFSLTILLPPQHQDHLALWVPYEATSMHLYANGKRVYTAGTPGTSAQSTTPAAKAAIVPLDHPGNTLHLVAHVANHHHVRGGMWKPPVLGTDDGIYQARLSRTITKMVTFGSILIMGLYHLTLWYFRRKDKAPLYFFGLSTAIATRLLTDDDLWIQTWLNLPYGLFLRLDFLTFFGIIGMFPAFMYWLFPHEVKRAATGAAAVLSLSGIATLLLPIYWFTTILPAFYIVGLLTGLYLLYTSALAAYHRRNGAWALFTGFVVFFATGINDILYDAFLIGTGLLLPFGLFFLILLQALALSSRLSRAFTTVEQLQEEVTLQNEEITTKSEELRAVNEALEATLEVTEQQRDELTAKNMAITDSITYAQGIQAAMLPPPTQLASAFAGYCLIYKPCEIVSGDFYWLAHQQGRTFVAVADCTGHGVPGALVSVVCNNALNRAVREFALTDPGAILDQVRILVLAEFARSGAQINDGMDIALVVLEGDQLHYAGAYNPLWLVRNHELTEVKGNRQPIGHYTHTAPFTTHTLSCQPGDRLYLFTDGFADQFGGPKGKKLLPRRFREMILQHQHLPMPQQQAALETAFAAWQGPHAQLDDICLLAVEV